LLGAQQAAPYPAQTGSLFSARSSWQQAVAAAALTTLLEVQVVGVVLDLAEVVQVKMDLRPVLAAMVTQSL